jgi:hypothetical protein
MLVAARMATKRLRITEQPPLSAVPFSRSAQRFSLVVLLVPDQRKHARRLGPDTSLTASRAVIARPLEDHPQRAIRGRPGGLRLGP